MPTIGIMIMMFTDSYVSFIPFQAKKMMILLTAIGTFILPALLIPLFIMQGKISNIELDERKERIYPLALISIFYLLTFILFLRIPVFSLVHAFMLGVLLSVAAAFFISLKWKISTHMMGIGGIAALVLVLSFKLDLHLIYPLTGVLIAAGIIGSSRIYLDAHTEGEVYGGFAVGFVVVMGCLVGY
jgi:membrane-associated phospholipid phosphatase